MSDTPTLKPCPTKADFTEAFDMTHRLIQEAKPREGYITDHLDAAEGWLDNLEEMLDAYRTRTDAQPTQSDALLEGDTQTILYLLGVRHGREDERAKIAAEASQPTQSDALQAENEQLRHDLERLRVEVKAQYDRGYYDGCTRAALDARGLEIRSKNDD